MARSFIARSTLAATFLIAVSGRLSAQHSHSIPIPRRPFRTTSHTFADPMNGMGEDWKMAAMAKHMAYSSQQAAYRCRFVRAAYVINELRQAIAKYRDVKVAEADGYKMFAPQIKNQPQYHFTKGWNAIRNQFGFDPARPTSLLYKKDAQGQFHLIGAMYTASKGTSEEDLNERVPLSVAHWHRHVNWCIPNATRKSAGTRPEGWTTGIRTARCSDEGRVRRSRRALHSPGIRLDAARQHFRGQRSQVHLARRPHGPRSRHDGGSEEPRLAIRGSHRQCGRLARCDKLYGCLHNSFM